MAINPVTSLTLTQNAVGDSLGTLSWSHDAVNLDRFMLGYKRGVDSEWTNLEPLSVATFGSGPYETEVLITDGSIEWRVVALEADGTHS